MKTVSCIIILSLYLTGIPAADNFRDGAFNIEFVDIGNAGNAPDNTGWGDVAHPYRIGKFEVSRGMIESYNALSGGPVITLSDMTGFGGNSPGKPATGVSWNEAARFVNWLNTSSGYAPAYKFITSGANHNIRLWHPVDEGYDPENPYRNSGARYFIPSEKEWYKAAFYDPGTNGGSGGFWNFATGSDVAPLPVAEGTATGTAVYGQVINGSPAEIMAAGGLSPYGTMGQSGNVLEWIESSARGINGSEMTSRVIRGGKWNNTSSGLSNVRRDFLQPSVMRSDTGFRVASYPVPPLIVDAFADRETLWPPNGKLVPVGFSVEVEGGFGQVDWHVIDVECDENADGDVIIGNDIWVFLRSTRKGSRAGRTYTIWLEAFDEAGHVSDPYSVEVFVPHDRRQGK